MKTPPLGSDTNQFFNSRTIGKSLREVAVDLIKTETEEFVSRWYHSNRDADLYTWVDQRNNIVKQQISFFGQVVEWNCVEGIKTGVVIESEMGPSTRTPAEIRSGAATQQVMNPSESILFDTKPQKQSVECAVSIIQNLEGLEAEFLKQMVGNFVSPVTFQSLGADAFIQKFGLSLKNYNSKDPGFWEKMHSKISSLFKRSA